MTATPLDYDPESLYKRGSLKSMLVFPRRKQSWLIIWTCVLTAIFLTLAFANQEDVRAYLGKAAASLPTWGSFEPTPRTPRIPNIVHFTHITKSPDIGLNLDFRICLSIFSAWYHWKPDTIYLHTNATDAVIEEARAGAWGKWSAIVLDIPQLVVHQVEVPTHANGLELRALAHVSDFVRVKELNKTGGVYIDTDVYPLRDNRVLRESNFGAVTGQQWSWNSLNSGVFMTEPGGRFISEWAGGMDAAFDGSWVSHSDFLMTRIARSLVALGEGDMLVLEPDAFTPYWNDRVDFTQYYMRHLNWADGDHRFVNAHVVDGTFAQGDALPDYTAVEAKEMPEWAKSWDHSYMLHQFIQRGKAVEMMLRETGGDYAYATPRYFLERSSNFARAVYPVVKYMYEEGLVELKDSHDGF